MGQQMSPGVQVNEVDLSIVVPALGNATAVFAGVFTKGPSDKFLLITNPEELINHYGEPTNDNYNDWFQCYNFLQYANKLLVSRAVDANGTFSDSGNTVLVANEIGKVEISNPPVNIQVGSVIKFDPNSEDEYMVQSIEAPVSAQAQVDTLTIDSVADGVVFTYGVSSVTATATDTVDSIASALGALIEGVDTSATNVSVTGSVITITASIPGIPMTDVVTSGTMTLTTVTDNIPGESYELVLDTVTDFASMNLNGKTILIKDSAINALVCAPREGSVPKTAAELKPEAIHVPNKDAYDIMEMSIPVTGDSKLKFIAKSSGSEMNGIKIAIAREADFASGKSQVFSGIALNDLFETKPSEANKEIAVIIQKDETITGTYVVSLIPGSKDYRNKSNYIEDVINNRDSLLYVKDNTTIVDLPATQLYSVVTVDANGVETTTNPGVLHTSNGSDGEVNVGDIMLAYGNVADNTIFGNKEELDIDIIIANEKARATAGTLASDRADCICFIGAKFDDVVGLPSSKIVENLIADAQTGELNSGGTANSFCAVFGNYKMQYDKFNDKMRWVSIAGDVAGLRADTNTKLNSWWASAGQILGSVA